MPWQLPLALTPYLETRRAWRTLLEMTLAARDAARRLQDVSAEAWTSNGLGIAYTTLDDMTAARDCFTAALTIRERTVVLVRHRGGVEHPVRVVEQLSRPSRGRSLRGPPVWALSFAAVVVSLARAAGARSGAAAVGLG